jgi:hypothetical protein
VVTAHQIVVMHFVRSNFLKLHVEIEQWPLVESFRITGYTCEPAKVPVVHLESARVRAVCRAQW